AISGVRHAQFNVKTGCLLIVHERTTTHAAIVSAIAHEIGVAAALPSASVVGTSRQPTRNAAPVTLADEHAWHALAIEEVQRNLGTSAAIGLSTGEAAHRLRQGSNALPAVPAPTMVELLWRQIGNLPTGLLCGS